MDNYEQAIALLNGFASLGSIGAADAQRRDAAATAARRGGKKDAGAAPPKAPKPKHRAEVERATKAVGMTFQLAARAPDFIAGSHLEPTEAWNAYWSPVFRLLARQCLNPCREVRHAALALLLRALLAKDLASEEHTGWTAIFGEVLFPLLGQLLKPEVYQSDPVGMGETRVQAATGLCKVFLHYLVVLAGWDGMVELWAKILGMMERLMNSGVGDNLVRRSLLYANGANVSQEEAVPESIKNILLVMADSGIPRATGGRSRRTASCGSRRGRTSTASCLICGRISSRNRRRRRRRRRRSTRRLRAWMQARRRLSRRAARSDWEESIDLS